MAANFIQGMVDSVKSMAGGAMDMFVGGNDEIPIEVKDGEEFYKKGLEDQKVFHPIWYRNVAMFSGQQWLDWSATTNWFQESAAPSWRVRITTNLILPKIRAMIATELQTNPRFYGIPANGQQTSKDSARIASRLFEAKYFEDDFLNKMIRLRLWTKMTGSAYLIPLWDQTKGKAWSDVARLPPTNQPIIGPDGMPMTAEMGQPLIDTQGQPKMDENGQPVMQNYAEGDVVFDVANSFEVIMQRGAPEDYTEHRRFMRVKFMDVGEIEDNWGIKVEPEKLGTDIMYQVRIMSLVDAGGRYKSSTTDGKMLDNCALVKDYYEVPTKKYPNGRHFTYANGKVLQATEDLDYYYKGRRALPWAKSDDIILPGRAQGQSTIEHSAPLNVQYNKMTSQQIENANLMGRPKVICTPGSMNDDAFTDMPGEIVEAVPGPNGQMPVPWTPPEMPQYFSQVKQEIKSNIEDVHGAHDVSLGRLPRRANSGVAIEALQSGDQGHVQLSIKSCASALTRAFSIALELMARKYTEERIVTKVGKDHEVEVMAFKGADLKGCDVVRVTFGPHLTWQQRIDMAMQLATEGIISKEQALEIMELGDMNVIFDKDQAQKQYSRFENFELAKGIQVPVSPLEPHPIHIKEHQDFANGDGANLPPEIKAIIQAHIQQHIADQAQQQSPQAILGGPGAIPGGGGAPGPIAPKPQQAGEGILQ